MRVLLLLSLSLMLVLGACSRSFDAARESTPVAPAAPPAPAPAELAKPGPSGGKRTQFLAYEHNLRVETQDVTALYESARSLCVQSEADACVVLRASVGGGESPYARLRLRATPEGISKVIALLRKQGNVAGQETVAEDLAGPVEDSARRLAMLTDYRVRLEGLRDRAGNDLGNLIKINRELAQTESEIEARTGERAGLMRRVQTQILDINMSRPGDAGPLSLIGAAIKRAGANLAEGSAWIINVAAFLLPVGVALAALGLAGRALWKRRRAKAA